MPDKLDEDAPDPGTLWLAIGIGVFSVLASFALAIYCASAMENSASPQPIEASTQASLDGAYLD